MRPYVDTSIGDWVVRNEDDDEYAIAIVKDIPQFMESLDEVREAKSAKKMREMVLQSLDHIEFGVVTIQKNGMVKWKGGEFVGDHVLTKHEND